MDASGNNLVDFIREKERQEKKRLQKRLKSWGIVLGVIALFIASGVVYAILTEDAIRRFSYSKLTVSEVQQLFREDPRPMIFFNETSGIEDTIKSTDEYRRRLEEIWDPKGEAAAGEYDEFTSSSNSTDQEVIEGVKELAAQTQGEELDISEPLYKADIMPSFPGGESSMREFLRHQIRYPDQAQRDKVEGQVVVEFVVESSGAITNVKVVRGIGSGCDDEAVRVVRMMPSWIPGEMAGQKVPVFTTMAVNFRFL
ncbi:TonB family protein [Pontibacter sp. G13]|uniref:TonB family protein n=1 Tax=Pontibacter sp. G13 TaxID=3074898 RepID=UPI0028893D25|nr:TonB family protein [Pontibacter sp. G13]WNJ18233.1 TonB family protein [Pontibacter sp. G13]